MNVRHQKQPTNLQRKATLPVWAIALILIGLFLYQYFGKGNEETILQSDPVTPTVITQTPPTVAAQLPPTTTPQRPPTVAAPPSPTTGTQTGNPSSEFDFYILNLSWSPDYCASNGNDDPQQCGLGKKLGFVLHGLWPQYNQGYPSDCSNVKLSASVKAKFPALYPNQSLYDHEWEKHGTCSGLSPEQYLALSKELKDSIAIPANYRAPEQAIRVTSAQLKQEFVAANPKLTESALEVYCSGSGRYLQELYVCFTADGKPTTCSRQVHNDAAKSCQNPDLLVRNVR
jgi:ribonuclease T2